MSSDGPTALLEDLTWLRTLARRLARDPHLAEDLVQDACAIALSRRTPPNQWRAWLTTVLQNLLCTHRRRERARLRRDAEVHGPQPDETQSLLQRAEAQQQLVAAVLQLEEPYRATVLLRFFEGLPPRRIATSQRVPWPPCTAVCSAPCSSCAHGSIAISAGARTGSPRLRHSLGRH
jgi:RNA polymerase sigma-70 factor (ECF subfamily)